MEKAEFSLVIAQVVVFVINFLLYGRQKSAIDMEKRDRGIFGGTVSRTEQLALAAKHAIDSFDQEKYKALSDDLVKCCAQNAKLEARLAAYEETVKSLSNKLASRVKVERKNQREDEPDDDQQPEPPSRRSGMTTHDEMLEQLKAQGIAVPLFPVEEQPQAPQARRPGFGRSLVKVG